MKNKTIVIMGGGTAGWISALYFLNKSRDLNLNLKVKLISSNDIESIGVGEGTTPLFTNFIENIANKSLNIAIFTENRGFIGHSDAILPLIIGREIMLKDKILLQNN